MASVPQPLSPPTPRPGFAFAAALAAGAAIAGAVLAAPAAADGWRVLHWIGKPLATLLLLGLAWRTGWPLSWRYRRRVCAGLLCALAGDVLLMLPGDFFVPGLVAFLLGHLCFLAAWLDDSRLAARPAALLGCLAAAAALVALLWPGLAPALRLPVIVYAAVLATMAGQALGRAAWHAAQRDALAAPARWAALGGLLFMASDSLLAWDRFRAPLPLAPLWILGTYYPALWAIARSVARSARTGDA
jgi:uncharacterized membrane protein YhhN